MSLCPSFYCTPCGKAHADECPPKPKVKLDAVYKDVVDELADLFKPSIPSMAVCPCGAATTSASGFCRICQAGGNSSIYSTKPSPKQVRCICGTWTSSSSGICRICQPSPPNIASFPNQPISPLPAMKIFVPTTGTEWTSESRLRDTDPWQVGNPNYYYRVIGHPTSAVKVAAIDVQTGAPGTSRDYPYSHWLDDGDIFQGVWLRFVFRP
jgi:hypothetical protein